VERFETQVGGVEMLSDDERALAAQARHAHAAKRGREVRLLRAWVATLAVAAVAAAVGLVYLRRKNRELTEGRVRAELNAASREARDHEIRPAVRRALQAVRLWLDSGRPLHELTPDVAGALVEVAFAERADLQVSIRASGTVVGGALTPDGARLRFAVGRTVYQALAPRFDEAALATFDRDVTQLLDDPTNATT